MAYFGRFDNVKKWFHGHCGYTTPQDENPADYFMQLLQDDDVKFKLCDMYEEESKNQREDIATGNGMRGGISNTYLSLLNTYPADAAYMEHQLEILKQVPKYPTSKWKQLSVLFRRASYDRLKDVDKFLRSIMMKFAVGLLIGIVWFGVGHPARNEKSK